MKSITSLQCILFMLFILCIVCLGNFDLTIFQKKKKTDKFVIRGVSYDFHHRF